LKWTGLSIVLLFSFTIRADAETLPSPPPLGKLVDAGGYRVHLNCTGTGTPTVVIAGGGFSFDWGLIQRQVANFTRVCTYDPSGTAWSDFYQNRKDANPNCTERVTELYRVLQRAAIEGPYVLLGFSIGGPIGRLYAQLHPEQVSGMVIVDHAFIPDDASPAEVSPGSTKADSPPVLISATPITLGIEDDANFKKLPRDDQELHAWAMSRNPLRPTAELAQECSSTVEGLTAARTFPLADRPLILIRTNNDVPGYARLQESLFRLSRNSKAVMAANSSHMVIIDQPEIVIAGVREVVEAVRTGTKLK
jgi:pimeloyl-ACP methyl ester carboxylesterase